MTSVCVLIIGLVLFSRHCPCRNQLLLVRNAEAPARWMASGISNRRWLISTAAQLPIVQLEKVQQTALVPWQGVADRVTRTPGVSHAARAYCYSLGRSSWGVCQAVGLMGRWEQVGGGGMVDVCMAIRLPCVCHQVLMCVFAWCCRCLCTIDG